jgi:hypothetical protein
LTVCPLPFIRRTVGLLIERAAQTQKRAGDRPNTNKARPIALNDHQGNICAKAIRLGRKWNIIRSPDKSSGGVSQLRLPFPTARIGAHGKGPATAGEDRHGRRFFDGFGGAPIDRTPDFDVIFA